MPTKHDADESFDVVGDDQDCFPRKWTVSIALPGSILSNAQSPELRAALAGQVARAAAIYCVDEIVIFREGEQDIDGDPSSDLALLLRYLDTPQYLRRHLFPRNEKLRHAGLLNPLNLPSHPAKDDTPRWREGAAVLAGRSNPLPNSAARVSQTARTRFIDVGVERLVEVDREVGVHTRVTVDLAVSGKEYSVPGKYLYGQIVPREYPRELDGLYWGYTVRVADSLLEALQDSPHDEDGGYDLVIGTSERGSPLYSAPGLPAEMTLALSGFKHLLIVFGGVQGLEHSAACDDKLVAAKVGSDHGQPVSDLFDYYLNTCPRQGSRTIRTEEAILISLAALQSVLRPG